MIFWRPTRSCAPSRLSLFPSSSMRHSLVQSRLVTSPISAIRLEPRIFLLFAWIISAVHLDSISAIHLATPNQRHITFCYPPGDAISRLVKWVGSPHYSIWCGLAYYFSSYLGAPTLPPREFMTYFEKGREKRKAGIGLGPEHRSWP